MNINFKLNLLFNFILISILIIPNNFAYSQPVYNEFLIGAFHNPNFTTNYDDVIDLNSINFAKSALIDILTFPYYFDPASQDFNDYLLDLCYQANMKYVVADSRHMIQHRWDTLPPTLEYYNSLDGDAVCSHYTNLNANMRSVLFGYRIDDEPAPWEMNSSHLLFTRGWTEKLANCDPTKYSLVNLLPMYSIYYSNNQGYSTKEHYLKYLNDYLNGPSEIQNQKIASLDNYLSVHKKGLVCYYDNLYEFAQVANGRPMWGHVDVTWRYLQALDVPFIYSLNFPTTTVQPDESYVRHSANSHLAYGFKGIVYFPYDNPQTNKGVVNNGVENASKDWVIKINAHIKNIVAPVIMNSHYIGTFHNGDFLDVDNSVLEQISQEQLFDPSTTPLVEYIGNNRVLMGLFFNEEENSFYIYLVNRGFFNNHPTVDVTIGLKGDKTNKIFLAPKTGPNWTYSALDSYFEGNITYFEVENLLPGEGRMIKIFDNGFGEWDDIIDEIGDINSLPAPGDYDGDGSTDISIKNNSGQWKIDFAANGFGLWDATYTGYGTNEKIPVPADYDGDGKSDLSVKSNSLQLWYVNFSEDGFNDTWDWIVGECGYADSHPVPADYDGDGKDDISVKNDNGEWKIDYAYNDFNYFDAVYYQYGSYDAHPVPADYDGDGKADLSVKTDWGSWYINYATDGFVTGWNTILSNYGDGTNHPVTADYDGDGKSDISIKNNNQDWKIDYSSNGFTGIDETFYLYGGTDVVPVPSDYDGDGHCDLSVKSSWGSWYIDYYGYDKNYIFGKEASRDQDLDDDKRHNDQKFNEHATIFPNPVNNSTKITFTLTQSSNVSIKIFDIFGLEIASSVQDVLAPGEYTQTFDMLNFASGHYFYKIETNHFVETGKILKL